MLFPPALVCAIAHPGEYKPFPLWHSDLCSFERNCWSIDEMIETGCENLSAECEKDAGQHPGLHAFNVSYALNSTYCRST